MSRNHPVKGNSTCWNVNKLLNKIIYYSLLVTVPTNEFTQRHRERRALPVSHGFDEERSTLTDWHVTSCFDSIVYSKHIIAVDTHCRHAIALTTHHWQHSHHNSSYRKPISELQSITCHMGSHIVTCDQTQVNAPHLNPNCTRITYPRGIEGWVDLGVWLHTKRVYPPADSHPCSY